MIDQPKDWDNLGFGETIFDKVFKAAIFSCDDNGNFDIELFRGRLKKIAQANCADAIPKAGVRG